MFLLWTVLNNRLTVLDVCMTSMLFWQNCRMYQTINRKEFCRISGNDSGQKSSPSPTLFQLICYHIQFSEHLQNLLSTARDVITIRAGDAVYMCAAKNEVNISQLSRNVVWRFILRAEDVAGAGDVHKKLGSLELDTRRDMRLSFRCHKNIRINMM